MLQDRVSYWVRRFLDLHNAMLETELGIKHNEELVLVNNLLTDLLAQERTQDIVNLNPVKVRVRALEQVYMDSLTETKVA